MWSIAWWPRAFVWWSLIEPFLLKLLRPWTGSERVWGNGMQVVGRFARGECLLRAK